MGNKLCKKRVDNSDTSGGYTNANKTPKTLNKIINKLNLKPKWKSDSNLEEKQIDSSHIPISTIQIESKPISRSTDWIDCALEAPGTPSLDPDQQRKETKKSIFNDDTTPTPPPRKGTLVRRSLVDKVKDAFKTSGSREVAARKHDADDDDGAVETPEIEEQIMVKRTINYNCPCGGTHTRAQHDKLTAKKIEPTKRSRSIIAASSNNSLPNYSDFRLSLVTRASDEDEDTHTSALSLPDENPKKMNRRSLTNDFDAYLTRAKSIGSLIPTVLHRLSTNKAPLAQIESDDSLNSINSMDNWAGLTMIEHYEPRESSLPRPSKKTDAEMISDLEGMIVSAEDVVAAQSPKPKPPARKSESLLKRIHKDVKSSNCTPPSTPEEPTHLQTLQEPPPAAAQSNDHSTLLKILKENKNADSRLNELNETNKCLMKNNLSPVHTYNLDGGSKAQKGHINDFLLAERSHDEMYKERIPT